MQLQPEHMLLILLHKASQSPLKLEQPTLTILENLGWDCKYQVVIILEYDRRSAS